VIDYKVLERDRKQIDAQVKDVQVRLDEAEQVIKAIFYGHNDLIAFTDRFEERQEISASFGVQSQGIGDPIGRRAEKTGGKSEEPQEVREEDQGIDLPTGRGQEEPGENARIGG